MSTLYDITPLDATHLRLTFRHTGEREDWVVTTVPAAVQGPLFRYGGAWYRQAEKGNGSGVREAAHSPRKRARAGSSPVGAPKLWPTL
jgi:hypothetical protein